MKIKYTCIDCGVEVEDEFHVWCDKCWSNSILKKEKHEVKINLDTALKIIGSFTVNVRVYPEFLDNSKKYCERNHKVANALLAINELKNIL